MGDGSGHARESRGFALYVGLRDGASEGTGIGLGELVEALGSELRSLAPGAESHALAVVAPIGTAASDLEVVLQATIEGSSSRTKSAPRRAPQDHFRRPGVVIDVARHRVLVDGDDARLTYKEWTLFETLLRNNGRTVSRTEIRDAIATEDEPGTNDRTIDVHVRRLRVKLGDYPDVIQTVIRKGYRFDTRSDVTVLRSATPSPDVV